MIVVNPMSSDMYKNIDFSNWIYFLFNLIEFISIFRTIEHRYIIIHLLNFFGLKPLNGLGFLSSKSKFASIELSYFISDIVI